MHGEIEDYKCAPIYKCARIHRSSGFETLWMNKAHYAKCQNSSRTGNKNSKRTNGNHLPDFLYHNVREFTSQLGPVNLSFVAPRGYRPLVLSD